MPGTLVAMSSRMRKLLSLALLLGVGSSAIASEHGAAQTLARQLLKDPSQASLLRYVKNRNGSPIALLRATRKGDLIEVEAAQDTGKTVTKTTRTFMIRDGRHIATDTDVTPRKRDAAGSY